MNSDLTCSPHAKKGPTAPGTKEIPEGHPNALAGLTFVFTGELSAFSREEIVELAKRFGGYVASVIKLQITLNVCLSRRVTITPSKVTSYVVLGESAGPSKLAAIERLSVSTLDEDGFLALIGSRKGKLDAKTKDKLAKAEEKIKKEAAEMARMEKGSKLGPNRYTNRWTQHCSISHLN